MWGRGVRSGFSAALILLVALCACARADDEIPGAEIIRFRNYGTEQGLSQASATVLAQDPTGFIWIGTQDGLNRFDGYEFRVFRHSRADPWSISDSSVTALAVASDGTLWVGTEAGGLSRYDPRLDRFEPFRLGPNREGTLASNGITALLLDHRDRLWVASTAAKLQWYDPVAHAFTDTPIGTQPRFGLVRALAEQSDGSILIGAHEGFWRCDGGAAQLEEIRYDPGRPLDVFALATDAEGGVWVSSAATGLYHFSAELKPLAHYFRGADAAHDLPDDELRGLQFDGSGHLWIAAKAGGLLQLDAASGRLNHYRHDDAQSMSIAANRQQSVLIGRDGLIWAGSWNNGISVHDPRTEIFANLMPVSGDPRTLPTRPVIAMAADSDDTLWFGLDEGGGLVHFDPSRGVVAHFVHDPAKADSLPENLIEYMKFARDGSLWLATAGSGLSRLAPGQTTFVHYRHDAGKDGSLATNDLQTLLEDRDGTLWIGTSGKGIDELCSGCQRFRHHAPDPEDPGAVGEGIVTSMLITHGGVFWIGLDPGGLDRFDRVHDRFEHFRASPTDPESLSADNVDALFDDPHGDLWIGTQGGGLNHLPAEAEEPLRFEVIGSAEGLAADAVGNIVGDHAGRLWLSTTRGISRIERSTRHIVNFGPRDGAQEQGYIFNSAAVLQDGRIAFGGFGGVTIFDPARAKLAAPPQPILLDVLLNNQPVALRWRDSGSPLRTEPWLAHDRAEFDFTQNNISFKFGALGFGDPESIEFAYLLEGHDRDWIRSGPLRLATYTDLHSGDYRLRVRARRDGDMWSVHEAVLGVHVSPAPWLSPLAFAAYAAAAALLALIVFWRAREGHLRQLRAQDAIRASEERLKYALWGSGGELWDYDIASGKLLRENRLEHLRASQEIRDDKGAHYQPYVYPEDWPAFEREMRAHIKGERGHFEASYRTRGLDGELRWLLTRGRVMARDANGRALRMVGTTQDITVLKSAEELLRRLNEELESRVEDRTFDLRKANAELRRALEQLTQTQRQLLESEKMAALGGLVAGVAHEINTPLGVTVTAASHLQEEARRVAGLAAEQRLGAAELEQFRELAEETSQLMLRNLQRADRLIRSFKLIAVDQGTEERRVIDLGAYLNEILVSLGPAVKKTPHRARVECTEEITLETYPGVLYQIVSNLVMNSLTHAFSTDLAGDIVIRAQRAGDLVEISYLDNGRGMDESVRARVFEPFFTTRRGEGGSGLGMHLVYNLVTQVLKGSIRVESSAGEGARFEIFFPLDGNALTR
jgi:ligand-binding sensor domain-containing protein/signal transduction histidine kinase